MNVANLWQQHSVDSGGVHIYSRWTPKGQKLGVSGHRGHQWIDAYGNTTLKILENGVLVYMVQQSTQESPANAKGTRDSSACMKAHCEQM